VNKSMADMIADVLAEWPPEDSAEEHAVRVADALTAAGFGPVKAAALTEALAKAEVIHVHHHDIEHHARSYNEGYDAAITQGLADDPTLADDWFQGKLRAAAAGALREAAGAVTPPDTDYPEAKKVRNWLRNRAATIEADR
jgi:hypothetical protein